MLCAAHPMPSPLSSLCLIAVPAISLHLCLSTGTPPGPVARPPLAAGRSERQGAQRRPPAWLLARYLVLEIEVSVRWRHSDGAQQQQTPPERRGPEVGPLWAAKIVDRSS